MESVCNLVILALAGATIGVVLILDALDFVSAVQSSKLSFQTRLRTYIEDIAIKLAITPCPGAADLFTSCSQPHVSVLN
jgi:hypothetical protein